MSYQNMCPKCGGNSVLRDSKQKVIERGYISGDGDFVFVESEYEETFSVNSIRCRICSHVYQERK